MHLIAWDKDKNLAITPERKPTQLEWARFPSGVIKQYNKPTEILPRVITVITTGAMQTRFSIAEEIAITTGTDEVAKVLLARLFNAKNINLDLTELTEGVAYIVNYLSLVGVLLDDVSASHRLDLLLKDGTQDEAYP